MRVNVNLGADQYTPALALSRTVGLPSGTITVTDTATGAAMAYHNVRGSLASRADTLAF